MSSHRGNIFENGPRQLLSKIMTEMNGHPVLVHMENIEQPLRGLLIDYRDRVAVVRIKGRDGNYTDHKILEKRELKLNI